MTDETTQIYERVLRQQVGELQQIERMLDVQGLLHIKINILGEYSLEGNPWGIRNAEVELSLDNATEALKFTLVLLQKQVASTARHIEHLKKMDAETEAKEAEERKAEFDKTVEKALKSCG